MQPPHACVDENKTLPYFTSLLPHFTLLLHHLTWIYLILTSFLFRSIPSHSILPHFTSLLSLCPTHVIRAPHLSPFAMLRI